MAPRYLCSFIFYKENTEDGIVIMLVGNKFDLIEQNLSLRKVELDEIQVIT
jgi:hypothetical protein